LAEAAVAAGPFGVLALLVGLWQVAAQLLVAPAGMSALAAAVLSTAVLAGVLAAMLALGGLLTRSPANQPGCSAAPEVLVGGLHPAA
jgi:hypothetical protein